MIHGWSFIERTVFGLPFSMRSCLRLTPVFQQITIRGTCRSVTLQVRASCKVARRRRLARARARLDQRRFWETIGV